MLFPIEMQVNETMKAERLDHIHAYTQDVDAVAQFFKEVFGLEANLWQVDQFGVRFCIIPSLHLKFMQPTDPNGAAGRLVGRREEGLLCVNLKVPNLEEAIAIMESRGIKTTARIWHGPVKQAWFDPKKTFGIQLELGEWPGDDVNGVAFSMSGPIKIEVGGEKFIVREE